MAIEYAEKEKPYELFDKAKRRGTWDPGSIELEEDRQHWEYVFDDTQRESLLGTFVAFYEGEESVARTLVPFLTLVDKLEDAPFSTIQEELYLTTHLYEEAKHADFFARYFEEVIGTQETEVESYEHSTYWQNPDLKEFLVDDLELIGERMRNVAQGGNQQEIRRVLAEGTMHYVGIVEAQLAKAGYQVFDRVFGEISDEIDAEILPGFQKGIGYVRKDEGRHMTNGRWLMKQLADEDPSIVTEIYEPKIEEYIDRLVDIEQPADDRYEQISMDIEAITRRTSNQNLQKTIEYIGADRFERFDNSIDLDDYAVSRAAD